MTSLSPQTQGPVVRVKPQPNIYTLLLIVGILILGFTIGAVIWNLTACYGLTFGQLFTGQERPPV